MNIAFIPFFIVIFLIAFAIGLTPYVLRSLGLYRLAKNRGIENAWLAWLPIGDAYIMGHLSEASPYIKDKFPKMHIVYPAVIGGYMLVSILLSLGMFLTSLPIGPANFGFYQYGSIAMVIIYVFIYLVALLIAAFAYFVLYHIYKAYDPNNAVLYLILSIIGLSFIFLFVIRNREPAAESEKLVQQPDGP